ncbi:hypothetical protein GCM10022409_19560 [Hymenobacter glaciei]|uniref:High light inducible protein n=1 Tax=Hymenobacter glaciei TaxID=877209 RepID=A0ABP7U2T3_9BACT
MLFVPYAPPADPRNQTPLQRKRANRLALVVFTMSLMAGLLVKYLG